MRSLIAAIDLGTTKVACIVGERIANKIKIIGYSQAPSKGIARGEVVNIQNVLDSITPVIHSVENGIGAKINQVFVGIAGQNIRCAATSNQTTRNDPDQIITKEEIDKFTNSMYNTFVQNGEKVLHVIPQCYNIDDFMGISDPVGMSGQQINASFKLFIGRNNSASLSKNVITRAGMELKGIILEPIASAKAVVSPDEAELGVAILDIGGGTSDLLIIQDNIIRHAAVIPFGGNSVTEDIKMGCGITSKDAEAMKVQFGSCCPDYAQQKKIIIPGVGGRGNKEIGIPALSRIIAARMIEIFEAIGYEIEKSGYKNMLKGGLVLTGGGARMQNIAQLATRVIGLEAKVAYPQERIAADSLPEVLSPENSTAVGLILAGFEIMDREKTVYQSVTPINYEFFGEEEEDKKPDDDNAGKPKEKKKLFKNLLNIFNTEKIFNQDNQA